ncbi:DUF2163 domain-containing protein [Stappia stellulata]|uniref:DUF2163 domain-containing protein n=1 Tax=Stappia stellulata TaxID=71235 RepID=UPI0004278344|nr:DUF2163 domain-containing protein [Stappia stellulata]
MKTISPQTAARFAGAATTRATCWRITRRDGTVFGFTDHDREIAFDGGTFRPDLGLETTAVTLEPDFAAGTAEVAGILSSPAISDTDLAGGLWDGAAVEVFAVDWRDPDVRVLMRRAEIGEVTRSGKAFRAELRGLAHLFDQPRGRVFSHICDADLGDARCRVDLDAGGFRREGTVLSVIDGATLNVEGVDGPATDWFAGGRLEIVDGPHAGLSGELVADRLESGVRALALLAPLAVLPAPGTAVRLTAGCDKRFATCTEKFSNTLNFQGFPHMPGTDFALAYPSRGAADNDGGPLVD